MDTKKFNSLIRAISLLFLFIGLIITIISLVFNNFGQLKDAVSSNSGSYIESVNSFIFTIGILLLLLWLAFIVLIIIMICMPSDQNLEDNRKPKLAGVMVFKIISKFLLAMVIAYMALCLTACYSKKAILNIIKNDIVYDLQSFNNFKPYGEGKLSPWYDDMQKNLHCCAATSDITYQVSRPHSCCDTTQSNSSIQDCYNPRHGGRAIYFNDGCVSKIESRFKYTSKFIFINLFLSIYTLIYFLFNEYVLSRKNNGSPKDYPLSDVPANANLVNSESYK